jgi:hypothetical protein
MWSPGPAEDDFQPGHRCDTVQCTAGGRGGRRGSALGVQSSHHTQAARTTDGKVTSDNSDKGRK